MSYTRKSLADYLDDYDAEIAKLQESKRDMMQDYRAQLVGKGFGKAAIKAEIEGFKVALRRRRAIKKKGEDEVEQADELADEIFVEITARAPRAAHARENIEEFDPETGEITEQPETATSSQRPSVSNPPDQSWEVPSAENDSDKISAPVPPSPVAAQVQQAKADDVPPPSVVGTHSEDDDFDPSKLTFLKSEQREDEKPDCLKLKDGHCKLSFRTSALCAECQAERYVSRRALA